jgi:hypothetical protein
MRELLDLGGQFAEHRRADKRDGADLLKHRYGCKYRLKKAISRVQKSARAGPLNPWPCWG